MNYIARNLAKTDPELFLQLHKPPVLIDEVQYAPELYFYDIGLICCLTKWSSSETLESGAMNGAILENYVVSIWMI